MKKRQWEGEVCVHARENVLPLRKGSSCSNTTNYKATDFVAQDSAAIFKPIAERFQTAQEKRNACLKKKRLPAAKCKVV